MARLVDLAKAGREAARVIWEQWDKAKVPPDPRQPEFANAAIDEFAQLLRGSSGVVRKLLEGAARGAEQLNVGDFHGVTEVVQNADDLRAKWVKAMLRRRRAGAMSY